MRTLKGWCTSLLRVYFLFVGMISPPSPLFLFNRMNSSFGTMNLRARITLKQELIYTCPEGKLVLNVAFYEQATCP